MVSKLFKHEFKAYLHSLIPVYIVLLVISAWGRIVQFFEKDTTVYSIIHGSTVIAYVITVIVCLMLSAIFCIIRFYKNMFSLEGYLTFTLPVTASAHLFTKLVTALAVQVASALVVVISFSIMTSGEQFYEILKAVLYILKIANKEFGAHLYVYIAEVVLGVLVFIAAEILLFYACISVGQTFRKNRILAAVGVYFGYYMLTQIVSTVIVVLFVMFADYLPLEQIVQWFNHHYIAGMHIMMCGVILWQTIFGTIYYLVSSFVMRRKLNLE